MDKPGTAALALAEPLPKRRPPPVETRWKKGQSGNPSGRPKGSLGVSEAAKMILFAGRKRCPRESARVSWNLAVAWIAAARKDVTALRELLDRTEGKVVVPLDHRHVVDIQRAIAEAHAAALVEATEEGSSG